MDDRILEKEDYILKDNGNEVITVRDLQLEVLSIMDEIHRVCEKNNIKYGLMAGSALGIVNYKGFIPWDDDIDVCVERKDWNRFIEALKKDLSDDFYFQCFETDKRFNVINGPTMKVRKKGTYIKEVNRLLKNRCKGDGIFVDDPDHSVLRFVLELNKGDYKAMASPLANKEEDAMRGHKSTEELRARDDDEVESRLSSYRPGGVVIKR